MHNKSNLAKFIDTIALFIIIFILLLSPINKLKLPNSLRLITTTLITLLILYFISIVQRKSSYVKNIKQGEIKKAKEIVTYFKFLTNTELANFFKKAISKNYKIEKITKNNFIILTNTNKICLSYNFLKSESSLIEIMPALETSTKHNAKLYFLSASFSEDAHLLQKQNSNLVLLDTFGTYNLLKELNYFPEISDPQKIKENKVKIFLSQITNKKLTKSYIKFSVLFFILSKFTLFSSLYKFFSILFLTLSIITLAKKPHTPPSHLPLLN